MKLARLHGECDFRLAADPTSNSLAVPTNWITSVNKFVGFYEYFAY